MTIINKQGIRIAYFLGNRWNNVLTQHYWGGIKSAQFSNMPPEEFLTEASSQNIVAVWRIKLK